MQCSVEQHVSWPSLTMTWLFAPTLVTQGQSWSRSKKIIMAREPVSTTSLSCQGTISPSVLMRQQGFLRRMEGSSPQGWLQTCFLDTKGISFSKHLNFLDLNVSGSRINKCQVSPWPGLSGIWLLAQSELQLNRRYKFSIVLPRWTNVLWSLLTESLIAWVIKRSPQGLWIRSSTTRKTVMVSRPN